MSRATQASRPQASPPPVQHRPRPPPPALPAPPAAPQPEEGGRDPVHGRCRQELLEAKALAANLEKTVRWWSDCSARWKEKWGKANLEKVRCRRECQLLRQKVKSLHREVSQLKAELGEAGEEEAVPAARGGQERGWQPASGRGGEGPGAGARRVRHPEKGADLLDEDQEQPATEEEDPEGVLAACLSCKCSVRSERGPGDEATVGHGTGRLDRQREWPRGTRQHRGWRYWTIRRSLEAETQVDRSQEELGFPGLVGVPWTIQSQSTCAGSRPIAIDLLGGGGGWGPVGHVQQSETFILLPSRICRCLDTTVSRQQ
ncbi:coiled-coil domain-containing protein 102A-like isoform X3 [Heterodontus francisci]